MKQQRVGWVIVTPRGKHLPDTFAVSKPRVWDEFVDEIDFGAADIRRNAFDDCDSFEQVCRKARRLGYRAEPVYREVK